MKKMEEDDILILQTQNSILREKIEYLKAILDCSRDIIVTTDDKTNVVEFNKGAEIILGYKKDEVIGKSVEDLYYDKNERRRLIKQLKTKEGYIEKEIVGKAKNGRPIELGLTLAELKDKNGKVIGTVGISKDVSRRKELERELLRLSITDELTGLYNHSYFYKCLERELEKTQKSKTPLTLIFSDLDNFKDYNDNHGHLEGDKVLRQIGKIITSFIRKDQDLAFRYGGDEFTVIFPNTKSKDAYVVADRIRMAVEKKKFDNITTSIGLCQFKDGVSIEKFVRTCDRAMYEAKNTGKNKIVEI